MDTNQTAPPDTPASPTSSVAVPVSPPAPPSDDLQKSPSLTRAPSAAGVRILKKTSTLGAGKDKDGVKFADAKGGKISASVYVENLYYLTSTRYQASLEAAQASQQHQQQPGGCCTIS